MEELNYWQRLARKRISRRRLLSAGGTAALGGAAALIVGCAGDDGDGGGPSPGPRRTPGAPGSPIPGGNVTFGRLLNVLGLDPHIDLTGLDIDTLLYPYLYSWRPGAEEILLNNLATAFEQPDPEHLEFIFTLRPGVKNQPVGPGAGEELTSEDCKQSFIRRGTSFTAPDKRFPRRIAGSRDAAALAAALQTPDKYTFSFKMGQPFVPAIREMANPTWAIVPAKVIDEFPSLSQKAFGSGPFMLEEFRGSERIFLRRHPEHFLAPRPWLDSITYIVITEGSSLLAAFDSGQHDVNGAILTRAQAEERMEDGRFEVSKAPSLFYPVIHLKMRPPFDQIGVRKAINLAINRDEMIEVVQDGEGNYNGPIQWPQVKWALPQEELRAFYRHDPAQAKQLLEDAGYGAGFDVRMKIPKVPGATFIARGASLVKDHLGDVGINVQIDEVELGAYIASTILPGNFDMAFFPNLPYDEPDRPLSFYHSLGVTGTGNWTNYSNPDLDKLIEAQAEEFDEQRRQQIIYQAQRLILNEHGPQLTLTGMFAYQARWSHVHLVAELGQDVPKDAGPNGVDIWTEEA